MTIEHTGAQHACAEIRSVGLCDFIILMVCIVSSHHHLPPESSWTKYTWSGASECDFTSLHPSWWALSCFNNHLCPWTMISCCLSGTQTQKMGALTFLVPLTNLITKVQALYPPLLVTLQYFIYSEPLKSIVLTSRLAIMDQFLNSNIFSQYFQEVALC